MNRVILDFDDVLVKLSDGWNKWLYHQELSDVLLKREDITSYDFYITKYGDRARNFFLADPHNCYDVWVDPFEGAKDFVKWCCDNFDDVEILTHATKEATKEAKKNFAKKHFNFSNVKFCRDLHDKYKQIGSGILVDDYPYHNIMNVVKNNNHSILFDEAGRNGWSKLENYSKVIPKDFDFSKLWIANDYKRVQFLLERLGGVNGL
jgi:hypothetical protein